MGPPSYMRSVVMRRITTLKRAWNTNGGTRWRSWLRHCATSRKPADSIPDGAIAIFHWHHLSGRTMALGLTLPLTEISTRNISWGKGGRCLGLTLPPSCLETWEPQPPRTLCLLRPVMGLLNRYRRNTIENRI
jgi:hypothetical protein